MYYKFGVSRSGKYSCMSLFSWYKDNNNADKLVTNSQQVANHHMWPIAKIDPRTISKSAQITTHEPKKIKAVNSQTPLAFNKP